MRTFEMYFNNFQICNIFLTFNFEVIIDSQEVAKKCTEKSCAFHLPSPVVNIVHNYDIISKHGLDSQHWCSLQGLFRFHHLRVHVKKLVSLHFTVLWPQSPSWLFPVCSKGHYRQLPWLSASSSNQKGCKATSWTAHSWSRSPGAESSRLVDLIWVMCASLNQTLWLGRWEVLVGQLRSITESSNGVSITQQRTGSLKE